MATFPRLDGDITDEPYANRQKLVLLPTEDLHALLEAFERVPMGRETRRRYEQGSSQTALEVTSTLARMSATRFLLGGMAAAKLRPSLWRRIQGHWQRWRAAAKLGLGIIYTDTDSIAPLRFPAGHAVHDLLYIAHPTDPKRYLVAAEFHHKSFEDKLAEAIGLLQALGTKTMTIRHVAGWSDEVSLSLGSEGGAPVKVKGSAGRGAENKILYEAVYDPDHEPALPDDLHWFHDEPLWRKLADGRLHANLRTFSLDVTYQQDFGIDVDLPVKVQKAGFKLGGEFRRHESTHWRITGEFAT